jgi:hypothetical protein
MELEADNIQRDASMEQSKALNTKGKPISFVLFLRKRRRHCKTAIDK